MIKDLLSRVTNDLTLAECDKVFQEIAETLMRDYAIQRGEKTYRLLEIEFYYYNKNFNDYKDTIKEKQITYPRSTSFGQWFFHSSGVDLTFNSNKDAGYGGGILIRKIVDEENDVTIGSLKCEWELFPETVDAFETTSPKPYIVEATHWDFPIKRGHRHNLPKDEERLWQYSMIRTKP